MHVDRNDCSRKSPTEMNDLLKSFIPVKRKELKKTKTALYTNSRSYVFIFHPSMLST